MNSICPILRCYYGAIPADDCRNEWVAVKVYLDGNQITLGGPFNSIEAAEDCAGFHHLRDLREAA
jgi:hypothetical protein